MADRRRLADGMRLKVDLAQGHKTGYYLDQRDNRVAVGALADGREVLDCFTYGGGFTLQALAQGARAVTAIDSSATALAQARAHVADNGLPTERVTWVDDDVFKYLRKLRDQGRQFDLVVLDPPKFAPTAASAERAARGYKDINLLALKLLRPGGLLASFSCSGGVSAELFRKIVAGAALDAGVDAQVLQQFHAAPDHPIALAFPEGIEEGCDARCTFCIIPRARGDLTSLPADDIVAEVRRLAVDHYEVVLTGTNVGRYGYEIDRVAATAGAAAPRAGRDAGAPPAPHLESSRRT